MPEVTTESRLAKALAHPLRVRILQRLGERVASPGDLAIELNAPLGVVSYHVRMLRDYECVELVRTEPRRGALQHFYRAIARPTVHPTNPGDVDLGRLGKAEAAIARRLLEHAVDDADQRRHDTRLDREGMDLAHEEYLIAQLLRDRLPEA